ncbi:MAG: allophycocyanin subunit alpha [Pleurocapsa sp.]
MLNDKVKELIAKSRIVSFESWHALYPPAIIAIFQQADDEKRYLMDEDIEQIQNLVPKLAPSLEQGKILRDSVNDIVNYARGEVLAAFPNITEPGGGLYPPMRAEACWRDFWHFLRCITYGISGQSVEYTSDRGLQYMEQLYQELQVPLDAMVVGLEQLKNHSLQKFAVSQRDDLAPYFDRLINAMKDFSSVV